MEAQASSDTVQGGSMGQAVEAALAARLPQATLQVERTIIVEEATASGHQMKRRRDGGETATARPQAWIARKARQRDATRQWIQHGPVAEWMAASVTIRQRVALGRGG